MKQCEVCHGPMESQDQKRERSRFCGRKCYGVWKRTWWTQNQPLKDKMAKRMKRKNPMHNKASHDKAVATLRSMGWKPQVRGGNGTGPTKAEWQLMRMFPESVWNYGVRTGMWRGSGYPTCYKLDIAFPSIKLGIEADGKTHNNPRMRGKDKKKTKFLNGLGWTVLRFWNKEILDLKQQKEILKSVILEKNKLIHA